MLVEDMFASHPRVDYEISGILISCIEQVYTCQQACIACADACLGEDRVQQLSQCIRLNLDCADICAAVGTVATRRTGSNPKITRLLLEACAAACEICGNECDRQTEMHEHCRICAEACRSCRTACLETSKIIE